MDDKQKIVLGSSDIISKKNQDLFIDINLQRTFNEFKKQKFNNDFDLAEEFRKERNASRNFYIYGIVDSTVTDCDNLQVILYSDSGMTQVKQSIMTTPLVYNETNVFGKKRGKYVFNLQSVDYTESFITIPTNNQTYETQIYQQQLIFSGGDGQFVEYGTQTLDIGIDGTTIIINNDFPFFYNTHFVKKDLDILEGAQTQVLISLDKPSPFGNEIINVDVDPVQSTANSRDYSLFLGTTPISTPLVFSFSKGEQQKSFTLSGNVEFVVEFTETALFNMNNLQNVNPGNFLSTAVNILDTTPRNFTKYNFGNVYNNRLLFTGRTTTISGGFTYSSPAILRNGLFFEGRNEEFYPNDTFTLTMTNLGTDTILPVNPSIGVVTAISWLSGDTKTFNVQSQYNGNTLNQVSIQLPTYLPAGASGGMVINGYTIILNVLHTTAYDTFLNAINGGASDVYNVIQIEKPFTFIENATTNTITLTSISPGVPLTVIPRSILGPNIIVNTIVPFVLYDQIPFSVTLLGNSNKATACIYDFTIKKPGYSTVYITGTTMQAASFTLNAELVTSYTNILRGYDDVNNICISNSGVTNTNNPTAYNYNLGDAYMFGVALLAIKTPNASISNLSSYVNSSGNFPPQFISSSFMPIPCTSSPLAVQDVAQQTILFIPPGTGVGTIFRSFDFRTGTTVPYTTYFRTMAASFDIGSGWFNNTVHYSSNTISDTSYVQGLKNLLDIGDVVSSILPGPVSLVNPGPNLHYLSQYPAINDTESILFTAKSPGVSFDIVNINDSLGSIQVVTITPNQIQGISPNPAYNFLGGFSIIHP
jgi:hypothetical protein